MVQSKLIEAAKSIVLDKIREAARTQHCILISYIDAEGVTTVREGEPYELRDGGLFMFCYRRNSIRLFKLDQILGVEVTNRRYSPRWPIRIDF